MNAYFGLSIEVYIHIYIYEKCISKWRVLTYSSWSWVRHLACKLRPLILRPLLVQEVALESSNYILHSVHAHRRTV